jgi:hypothetical protein
MEQQWVVVYTPSEGGGEYGKYGNTAHVYIEFILKK